MLDFETGQPVTAFEGRLYQAKIALSPDGRTAVGTNSKEVVVFERNTGERVRSIPAALYGSVTAVAYSPGGDILATGDWTGVIRLWNAQTGEEAGRLQGTNTSPVTASAFSPDGRLILTASEKQMTLWDAATGQKIRSLRGHEDRINVIRFLPDGRALSGSGSWQGKKDNTVRLWDVSAGKEIRRYVGHLEGVYSLVVSPDGRRFVSKSDVNRMWEVDSGKTLRTFKKAFTAAAFTPEGKYLLTTADHSSSGFSPKIFIEKMEIRSERVVTSLAAECMFGPVVFSPDGKYGVTYIFEVFDLDARRKIRSRNNPHTGYVQSMQFSPDGRYVLSGGQDNQVKLCSVPDIDVKRSFQGHSSGVNSVGFSPDGRFALSASSDGTTRIWDIPTEKEIVRMIYFADGEWIAMTPQGYYTASASGDRYLNVRIGNRIYGIDQFRSSFYKPEVVEAALELGDPDQAVVAALGEDKGQVALSSAEQMEPPAVVIRSPRSGSSVGSESVILSASVEDRNHPLQWVRVYVNGQLISGRQERGIAVAPDDAKTASAAPAVRIPEGEKVVDLSVPVTLERGANLIEVAAFNGFSEAKQQIHIVSTVEEKQTILPNLWILSIGINRYEDPKLVPLSYAVDDAEGIAAAFRSQEGKLFRQVHSLIISDRAAVKPTYANIVDNLGYLGNAGHRDVVILFIAGHGMNDHRGDFYFLPSDAVIEDNGTIKRSRAVSWRVLKETLDLPAKKIIFADTCHSEGLGGRKTRAVDNDRFVKELQEANAVIFTSSRGRELSQESDEWKHGAFTYSLIEGIGGKANLIQDEKISMKELDAYVSETVPVLTNGAQHPITQTPDGYVNFPVAIIK